MKGKWENKTYWYEKYISQNKIQNNIWPFKKLKKF